MALRRYQKWILGIISLLSVLLVWMYISTNNIVNPLVLPAPAKIAEKFVELTVSGKIFSDIWISMARIIIGFTLAFLVALPLGMIAGSNEIVRNILKPWIQLLQPIPGIAWVPFAFLIFGLSDNAAIFVISIAAFFPLFINVMNGVQRFDRDLINVAKTLGANNFQIITKVLLPGIVPDIITGSRVSMGYSWRAVVAAEMIGLNYGIGSMLIEAKNTAQTDAVIASMITLGLIMIIFERVIFETLEREIRRWKGEEVE